MRRRRFQGIAAAAALLAVAASIPARAQDDGVEADPDADNAAARGKYVMYAAGCVACHTADRDDAVPLAGGRALETPFGTFHTPNITPDSETGIGGWSETDFLDAVQHGLSPDGSPYYPAFPYASYAGMRDADARDLFAYLKSLAPVRNEVPDHELRFPYSIRTGLWAWRLAYFDAAAFESDPGKSETWNRGAYLVNHLGHCGECHTPRNFAGARIDERHLAGNPQGPEGKAVPNITPSDDGIGDWSDKDITFFLFTGFFPDGDVAGGGMGEVIEDSTSHLTEADRAAIATYLMSVEPKPDQP